MPKLLTNLDLGSVARIVGMPLPLIGTDGANKDYVDSVAQGLIVKQACRAASVAPIVLAVGPATIDTVSMAPSDRVLVKDQASGSEKENGIYVWNGLGVPMTRALDFNSSDNVNPGSFTFVAEGSQADTGWVMTTNDPIVVGTTPLLWAQFSSAGIIVAGTALERLVNTLNVRVDGTTIAVNGSNQLEIATAHRFSSHKYAVPIGDGLNVTYTVTHNLGVQSVLVSVRDTGTNEMVIANVDAVSINSVTVTFLQAPSLNQYEVTVIG